MTRWNPFLAGLLALGASVACHAQGVVREAPKDVKPAVIAVSATPPVITLNGKPDRLSPGSRIRDTHNMLVLSGALAGQTVHTVYRRDTAGLVHEVWLLTPQEYSRLGGSDGDPEGHKRLQELLNMIWTGRVAAKQK